MKKKPKQTRTKKWTDEEVQKALISCKGFVREAARELGCSRQLINQRAKANPEIRRIIRERKKDVLVRAQRVVSDAIFQEEDKKEALETSKWLLKTRQAKDLGYDEVKRVQMGNDPEHPLPVSTTQVNLISIHDLPLEQRQLLYEQVKQIQQAKEQTNPTEDV